MYKTLCKRLCCLLSAVILLLLTVGCSSVMTLAELAEKAGAKDPNYKLTITCTMKIGDDKMTTTYEAKLAGELEYVLETDTLVSDGEEETETYASYTKYADGVATTYMQEEDAWVQVASEPCNKRYHEAFRDLFDESKFTADGNVYTRKSSEPFSFLGLGELRGVVLTLSETGCTVKGTLSEMGMTEQVEIRFSDFGTTTVNFPEVS